MGELRRRFSKFSWPFRVVVGLLPPLALVRDWLPPSVIGAALVVSSSYLLFLAAREIWRKSEMPEICYLTAAVSLWFGNLLCWFVYDLRRQEVMFGWGAYVMLNAVGFRLSHLELTRLHPESKAYFALWLAVITDGAFFHPRVFVIGCIGLTLWMLKSGFIVRCCGHMKGN